MITTSPRWLDASGPDADIVISTRSRLARNLAGFRFSSRNDALERENILTALSRVVDLTPSVGGAGTWHRLDRMPPRTRRWFFERHLISREHAALHQADHPRSGAAVWVAESRSMMVNEEDHLRIQSLVSGLNLDRAGLQTSELGREIGERLRYAFTPRFGYLTSCPSNVGTGLRASVLIHLPGLAATGELGKILQGIAQMGLTHRGFWGEGSEAEGNLLQISNQKTLGQDETDLAAHLERVVREVIRHERGARASLQGVVAAEDMVCRAWGTLRHARLIGVEEMMELLGHVRLGVGLGVLPAVPMENLNHLLVAGQETALARVEDPEVEALSVPMRRARIVQRLLSAREPA